MSVNLCKIKLSANNIATATILLLLTFVSLRFAVGGFNASHFVVAGSDYVVASETPNTILVKDGQGYDGQFFYRYALNPLNFNKTAYGITVDEPSYRMQRIAYPAIVWALSLGNPKLVPPLMVLVNLLAFLGIIFFVLKLAKKLTVSTSYAIVPLFLYGLFMSLSRNLGEVVELFFFMGSVYYLFKKQTLMVLCFALLTLLTRETSIIAILFLLLALAISHYKNKEYLFSLLPILPLIAWLAWRIYVLKNMDSANLQQGYNHIGLPFKGIYDGMRLNWHFETPKQIAETFFYTIYLFWQTWFVVIIIKRSINYGVKPMQTSMFLQLGYLAWLLLAILFSATIYADDWGFVRVFSLWNLIGILLLMLYKQKLGKVFITYSSVLLCLTLVRLIVRI